MKILDKYILQKFLSSFALVLILLLPIAIAIDVSEKIDKFLRNADLSVGEIINDYYVHFVVIFGNTFMPLALFIAVIFFTSKLAGNTEIIAIHSAKISFTRFLRPYFIGASIVTFIALGMNHFVVPNSNKIYNKFSKTYLKKKNYSQDLLNNINLQLGPNDYIYLKSYNSKTNQGHKFSYEKFDGTKLKYKLMAENIRWIENDTIFRLNTYKKRFLLEDRDSIETGVKIDTLMAFKPKDLINVEDLAKEMTSFQLIEYINKAKNRGVGNLNTYLVELYKRTSLPISSYILTFIAVSLAAKKRRGGMGVNLAIGITLMFIYVFFLKIAEVLGAGAETNALVMVWLPNIFFGALAVYLYLRNAKTKLNNYLHLHLLVFIWGFTAILGALININAIPLVWYRMLFAVIIVLIYFLIKRKNFRISKKAFVKFLISGIIIALHWIAFFSAIKVSNVSIALVAMSTGALFTSLIEPLFFKRKLIFIELLFGLIVISGLYVIFNVESEHTLGIIYALIASFLSALFTVLNGLFIKQYKAETISFYQLLFGVVFITIYILFTTGFTIKDFSLTTSDILYLLILSSFCTAYAFIVSVKIMKHLTPYTVMLTINLEPIYGIILAVIIFGEKEKMSPQFYIGALVILITVITNGILKNKKKSIT